MTESELEVLRLKFKIEVQHYLVRALYIALARAVPNGRQMFLAQFASIRQEQAKMTFQGLNPSYSDMVSAEWQEALDDALSDIENGLQGVP